MDAARQEALGRGVLRQAAAGGKFSLARAAPPDDLAPFLDFFWIVRWDLGDGRHEQSILPHPNVNLAFETAPAHDPGSAAVYGVDTAIFTRRLTGAGKALGARFRPGGFRPFAGAPVASLSDRVVPAREFFGPAADETARQVVAARSDADMIAAAAALLQAAAPAPDPVALQVADIAGRIIADPGVRRVSQLARLAAMSERQLQRLFAEYVGVSPKWMLRRARLHEAAQRADAGEVVGWAQLAADLGYADQAHLTRDFTATIGVPPAQYAT